MSSVTGRIKFFDKSMSLAKDGATIAAFSGQSSAEFCLDRNPDTKWRSVNSNDLTQEELIITFSEDKTFNRLFFLDHNWKDFTIKYDVLGVWTHFSSVFGLDGSKANITETAFADDTAYYEFAQVTTGSIQILINKTQVANQEKYIAQAVVTEELATLLGYPKIKEVEVDRNIRSKKTLNGKYVVMKSLESSSFDLDFKDYPSSSLFNADLDVMMALHDREDSFLVWICGGRRGSPYFRYTLRGFRLRDVITMQVTKSLKLGYTDNIYSSQLNTRVTLEETI